MSLLQVEGLEVDFGGVDALRGVDLAVAANEVVSLIGPNGAGKTTVFNAICRLVDARAGRIRFGDRDITRMPGHGIAALGIARTFQNIDLFGRTTVLHNLLTARHISTPANPVAEIFNSKSVRTAELRNREKVEEVLEFLGLQRFRDEVAAHLPYGIQKVVELARALCLEPTLLMLDEPAAGLDGEEIDDMAAWIRDINLDRHTAILMIEHHMNLVAGVSDRVVVLDQGQVLLDGTPEAVQASAVVAQVYMGEPID